MQLSGKIILHIREVSQRRIFPNTLYEKTNKWNDTVKKEGFIESDWKSITVCTH
jgi:hypothetical protein